CQSIKRTFNKTKLEKSKLKLHKMTVKQIYELGFNGYQVVPFCQLESDADDEKNPISCAKLGIYNITTEINQDYRCHSLFVDTEKRYLKQGEWQNTIIRFKFQFLKDSTDSKGAPEYYLFFVHSPVMKINRPKREYTINLRRQEKLDIAYTKT